MKKIYIAPSSTVFNLCLNKGVAEGLAPSSNLNQGVDDTETEGEGGFSAREDNSSTSDNKNLWDNEW